jgi:hypothetical protein
MLFEERRQSGFTASSRFSANARIDDVTSDFLCAKLLLQ